MKIPSNGYWIEPIDLDFTIKPAIPKHLENTKRHFNCPALRLTRLKSNGTVWVLLGTIVEKPELIAIAKPTEFGYRGLHIVRAEKFTSFN